MKQGDFTEVAKNYIHRPGYSDHVIQILTHHVGAFREGFRFADVGAGTGKLTAALLEIGLTGYAVEPNDAMREEGIRRIKNPKLLWLKGTAENTGMEDSSIDWVLMASSFHWTDRKSALREFYRILKPEGMFTALWNPRDLERNEFQKQVEKRIHQIAPDVQRVSSGFGENTRDLYKILTSSGHFSDPFFIEAPHELIMDRNRYLGVWQSVNDIRSQAGEEKFSKILKAISDMTLGMDQIVVSYMTRAWSVRVIK